MSFEDSAKKAFESDRAKKYAEAYLSENLTTWRDCEKSVSRTALALLVTCVLAELIHLGVASEASFAGIKVTNFKLIQIFLPVAIAFLYSNLMSLALESTLSGSAFQAVFGIFQPELTKANLDAILPPANMTFQAMERIRYHYPEKAITRRSLELSTGVRNYTLILAPIAYEIYLFVTLFGGTGPITIELWISLVLSIILFSSGFVSVVAWTVVDD